MGRTLSVSSSHGIKRTSFVLSSQGAVHSFACYPLRPDDDLLLPITPLGDVTTLPTLLEHICKVPGPHTLRYCALRTSMDDWS